MNFLIYYTIKRPRSQVKVKIPIKFITLYIGSIWFTYYFVYYDNLYLNLALFYVLVDYIIRHEGRIPHPRWQIFGIIVYIGGASMEINYIKEFVVLAETENYLEASQSLFISQSSLSKHIQAMEKELGVSLFDRTTRKVRLNEAGKIFLTYAKEIANLQYSYTTALINQSDHELHTITIGSIPIMAPYHITDAIIKFKLENKRFAVNLVEGESSVLKEHLRQHKCDIAFIRDENDDDDEFIKVNYETDSLVAILPSYHPLAGKASISLKQLKDEDFLFLQPGSLLYSMCIKYCQKEGYTPNIIYTGERAENIIDLVEKGMGVSLLMKKPIAYLSNPKIALVDITPSITTSIKIYHLKNQELSIAAKHFIDSTLTTK